MNYIEIRDALLNGTVEVIFTKLDGTERVMNCTLNEQYLPASNRISVKPKMEVTTDPVSIPVWDLDANAWRAFRLDSVKSIRTTEQVMLSSSDTPYTNLLLG